MFNRDYEQHSKNFDKFKAVLIIETDNCEQIEELFEQDIKVYQLHRVQTINGTKYYFEFLINHIKELVTKYPLPAIK